MRLPSDNLAVTCTDGAKATWFGDRTLRVVGTVGALQGIGLVARDTSMHDLKNNESPFRNKGRNRPPFPRGDWSNPIHILKIPKLDWGDEKAADRS